MNKPRKDSANSGRDTGRAVCIGIGSNLDDPIVRVRQALRDLAEIESTTVIAESSLYRNPPMGPADQPHYINAVAKLSTTLAPRELLSRLQDLERRQGRVREAHNRWGPRRLDLDILTYGDQTIAEPGLQIPHPGISERNFVLFPLLEIAPQLHIPGLGHVRDLVLTVDSTQLEKIF